MKSTSTFKYSISEVGDGGVRAVAVPTGIFPVKASAKGSHCYVGQVTIILVGFSA